MAEQTTKPVKKHKVVATKARAKTRAEFGGFVEFLRTQGVVGLAIGFILGTQAKVLVDQFSASFINPILGLVIGGGESLTAQRIQMGSLCLCANQLCDYGDDYLLCV